MVASNVGAYAKPIAEHVMAMTLALARRLPQRHAAMARGEWPQRGGAAAHAGRRCVRGPGLRRHRHRHRRFDAGVRRAHPRGQLSGHTAEPTDFTGTLADLDQVLAAADVMVISLPLTQATRGLIGARELRLMKPGAIVVNVARAAIVDERALYEHLRDNPGFSAGIDAWWHEPRGGAPFRANYPFFELPNLLGSPHNSGDVHGNYVLRGAAGGRERAPLPGRRRGQRGGPARGLRETALMRSGGSDRVGQQSRPA